MIPIEIIKNLVTKDVKNEFVVSNDYSPVPLNKDNFHKIDNLNIGNGVAIDGGSSTIVDAGPWLIAKIKVGAVKQEGTRTTSNVDEYYAVITSDEGYKISIFTTDWKEVDTIEGFKGIEITEVVPKVMKIMEWKKCLELSGKEEMILMDSSLEPSNRFEEELISQCRESNSTIVGFCKTSRMRTNSGRSALGAINQLSGTMERWYYFPIFSDEKSQYTYIAKLNKMSNYCYKVQLFKQDNRVFERLAYLSSDSEIAGYPYILAKADKVARVNSYEESRTKKAFGSYLKKSPLEFDIMSNSFHQELDTRMYK